MESGKGKVAKGVLILDLELELDLDLDLDLTQKDEGGRMEDEVRRTIPASDA